jgi:hypothetical protein
MNQPSYEICARIRIPVSQEEGEIVDVQFETENGDWEYTVICNDGREVTVYESEISCICSG